MCPGYGQDRVNFHQNPGRDTAGRADPTWPNRTGYCIPFAVMLGSSGGKLGGGNSLAARERAVAFRESGSLGCAVCVVFSPYLYRCCYCSVKLPLSRPTSFCLFLSILLQTPAGGGAAPWRFCCRLQWNYNTMELRVQTKIKEIVQIYRFFFWTISIFPV